MGTKNEAIVKIVENGACEVVNVNFGKGNVGIGLDTPNSGVGMNVILYALNNKYPLGAEVPEAELDAWRKSNLLVSLNFSSFSAINNFIKVLKEFTGKSRRKTKR